jgi:hypothetical protein
MRMPTAVVEDGCGTLLDHRDWRLPRG